MTEEVKTEAPVEVAAPAAPVAEPIQTVSVSVEIPKETHELAQGIVKMVKAAREALKDGFQPTQDVPVLLMESVKELPAAVGGLDKLGAEAKADKGKLIVALSLAVDELL